MEAANLSVFLIFRDAKTTDICVVLQKMTFYKSHHRALCHHQLFFLGERAAGGGKSKGTGGLPPASPFGAAHCCICFQIYAHQFSC